MLFPVKRHDPFDPPSAYRPEGAPKLRRVGLSYGGEAWLVADYQTARSVLADSASFSSDSTRPGYPTFPLASKRPIPGHFLTMDPPDHTRLRQLIASEFSAKQVRSREARITATAVELIEKLRHTGGPADLVSVVAVPLPGISASELLGTPMADRDFFLDCTRDLQLHDATQAQRVLAAGRMNRYLEKLLVDKTRRPGDDLLSRLAKLVDVNVLSMTEAVGVANLVIVAGLETTAGLFALTILSLLRDSAQGDLVRANPQRWKGPAVAEALRYWTLAQHGVARTAIKDVDIAGELIREGDAVVIHLASANRDPETYSEPDNFDITREARNHLAFGHGVHRCLGSIVAQSTAEIAVAELTTRLPSLRLADPAVELEFLEDMLVYGLRELPVAW